MLKKMLQISAGFIVSMALCQAAIAQGFPTKPVKIIVPSAAGGGLDFFARLIADKLSSYWGQPVLVDNRPGAGMALGSNLALKSPADGYTLLYAHDGALIITPIFQPKSGYTIQDVEPIAQLVYQPLVLVSGGSSRATSAQGLLTRLRANPGKLNGAYAENYSLLMLELFKARSKLDFLNVPYNGAGPASSALMAGEVDFSFQDIVTARNTAKSNRTSILAIATTARAKSIPDVPTMKESGIDDMLLGTWSGLVGPVGIPPAIVSKINADVQRAMTSPDVVKRLEEMGVPIKTGSPRDLDRLMREDAQKWAKLVAERNIKVEQ